MTFQLEGTRDEMRALMCLIRIGLTAYRAGSKGTETDILDHLPVDTFVSLGERFGQLKDKMNATDAAS